MTKTEFRKACIQSGYASNKTITEYIRLNPKADYTSEDFMGAYRLEGVFTGIKKSTKRKS